MTAPQVFKKGLPKIIEQVLLAAEPSTRKSAGYLVLPHKTSTSLTIPIGEIVSLLVMTHKYRGCIVVLSINKSVEPNEEQKVLMSSFDQGITLKTSKQVFRSIW
jgi:hypothetical protein